MNILSEQQSSPYRASKEMCSRCGDFEAEEYVHSNFCEKEIKNLLHERKVRLKIQLVLTLLLGVILWLGLSATQMFLDLGLGIFVPELAAFIIKSIIIVSLLRVEYANRSGIVDYELATQSDQYRRLLCVSSLVAK